MANEDTTLIVGLEARVDAFEKAFNKAGRIADTKFSAIERRTKQAGDRMRESMSTSVEAMNRVLGAIGVGLGLDQLREMADAYASMSARINQAAGSAAKGAAILERLNAIASRTRTSSEATAAGFLKAHQAMTELGYSTETQLKFQEALNDAFKVSGTSADGAAEVQATLTKALEDGGIEGKQLNAIFEQGGRVAKALADGLGVPTTQLKKLADQGKLTSTVIIQSLVGSLGKLRTEAAAMLTTIGESMTMLKDALSDYVGKAALAQGVTGGIAAALTGVASHFDAVGNAAVAAAAVILASYVPGMARAAAAGLAMVATNPFLLMATVVAGAAFAVAEFGDKIEPIAGDMANLQDYSAVVWADIKSGATTASHAIEAAFVQVASAISRALGGGETSMDNLAQDALRVADLLVGAWKLIYEAIVATFTKLPSAIDEAIIGAMNGMIATVEAALNAVIHGVNLAVEAINKVGGAVGVSLGEIGSVNLGRITNRFAGAGKAAADAYIGAIRDGVNTHLEDSLKGLRKDANKHAVEREASKPTEGKGSGAIDSKDNPVYVPPTKENDFEKEMRETQERIRLMQAETAERKNFVGSFEEEDAAVKRAETAQNLLNAAQHAGLDLNDETISRISALADAYSKASSEAQALAKTEEEAKAKAKELEGAGEDMAKGFVKDLASGKGAAEALRSALAKLGDKMLDMGMDALWKSMMDNGGNGMFEGLAKAMTPAEKAINAPGSSLAEVKKAAADMKTANMSVTAGSVTVNGPGATGADTSATGSLPDHPHTPTPGATDTTSTGSLGPAGDADKIKAAGSIDTSALLPGGAAAAAGAGGLGLHDRNLGAGFGGGQSAASPGAAGDMFKNLPAYSAKTAGQYQDAAFSYLRSKGYTSKEAETIMGNLQQESQFNPRSFNPNDAGPGLNSEGIFQANRGRLAHLHDTYQKDFGRTSGLSDQDQFHGQLDALDDEIRTNPAYRKSLTANAPSLDAGRFGHTFEGYGDKSGPTRDRYAQGFANKYGDPTTPPLPAAMPTPQLADASQNVTKFTQSLTTADGGLGQFSGSLFGLAKGLLGGIGGGGGGGAGGLLSGLGGLFGGFAEGGLISGDGTPTSDSNVALVSDGEYIVNAKAVSKNKALLQAINSGKAPKFSGSSQAAFLTSNIHAPTVNVHVEGGSQERALAQRIAGHVGDTLNQVNRFRPSAPQQHASASASLSKARSKNG